MSAYRRYALLVVIWLAGCTEQPAEQWQLTEQGGVLQASLAQQGGHALLGSVRQGASYWQLAPLQRQYDWNHQAGQLSEVQATALSANGHFASTADAASLVLWDTRTGQPLAHWALPGVSALAVSDDGLRVLAGLQDGRALLFEGGAAAPRAQIRHGAPISALALTADGRQAVTAATDGVVQGWRLADGQRVLDWRFSSAVTCLALSVDGRLLFAGRAHGPGRLWRLADGQTLGELGQPRGSVAQARFSADGSQLLTGHIDGSTRLWQVNGAQLVQQWRAAPTGFWRADGDAVRAVAFAPQAGHYLALLGSGRLLLWQTP